MTAARNNKAADNRTQDGFVSSYLLYLLAAASDAASSQFHHQVRDAGLRVPEWRVIACLFDQDGEMITRLAEYSLIEQSRLTRIIDQMDRRGLVQRKTDSADRRRVRVYLTAQGRKVAATLVDSARRHEKQLLASLEGASGENLKHALQSLLQSLNR